MAKEFVITEQMREWGKVYGWNVDEYFDYFVDYLANKTGKPYKDVEAAFRNCVRSDWPGVRKHGRAPWLIPQKAGFRAERTMAGRAVWVAATDTTEGYWKKA